MTENEFIAAVKRNNRRLYLIAFSYTQNQQDAEDIMQNAFVKLWKAQKAFESNAHTDNWLIKVCVNECKDSFRLFFKKHSPLDETPELAYNDKHFNIDLFNAVSSLSKKERLAVHLFYYEDMPIKEISVLMNIKESTIKSLLRRARKKLKEKLGDEWINE